MTDRSRLVAFAAAVGIVFALGAGLGEIVSPIDVGSGHGDHPATSTTMDPNMDMSTHAPAG
ncbi:MAG: hypothetical protein AB7V43_20570 [Acidimicrobiia bacterium]